MKLFRFLLIPILAISAASAAPSTSVSELKQRVAAWQTLNKQKDAEIVGLQADLKVATEAATSLTADKEQLDADLQAMKLWGIQLQKDADKYWAEARKYTAEALAHKKTLEKYHRIKLLGSLISGMLCMFIYLRFNSGSSNSLASALSGVLSFLGPYAWIAQIVAPILAFVAGFLLIYLPF